MFSFWKNCFVRETNIMTIVCVLCKHVAKRLTTTRMIIHRKKKFRFPNNFFIFLLICTNQCEIEVCSKYINRKIFQQIIYEDMGK